ncbi:hypothetical protein [Campylobacter geochelonis]|uniref:hypothetical protein n=1 Tax=Campylobacter geochelonis TaxID=1780362 RepID=UPI0007707574|nr:hypothetical protein [Campylobacter geochelonis]CZE49444.1 anaerobic C4-dicarboxylate transporter DcuA [Campylobacter geochelonis]CZE51509.1 anaerobic C4-dicarboxylate transporter DcuA [Campylobacter geochelonis]
MAKNKDTISIVTINRTTENAFVLKGNEISNYELTKSSKSNEFYITYIPYKDIVTTTVEISRTTPEEEINDAIVIKTYEDLGLDAADDYKITYNESPTGSNDSKFYNVFVVNNAILNGELSSIASLTHYIDYVAQAPFLMSALYKRNILVSDGVDCFIYLQKDDAFLVVYQNGEYFESRSLRYNLKYLCDKFSEATGNKIDEQSFYKMLSTEGINLENPIERDHLIQLFDDIFFYLGDIINSINKIHGLNIQNIYFSTDIGHIIGVEAFIEDRLGLIAKNFDFTIAINSKDFNITQLDVLMMLTAQSYISDKNNDYNYSNFLRPPPLFQRNSGKLIAVAVAALFLSCAYAGYQYAYGMYNQSLTDAKTEEFNKKSIEENRIKTTLSNLQKNINETKSLSEKENKLLDSRRTLLGTIHDKKMNYPMKSVAIYNMSNMINDKEGKMNAIIGKDNNLTFSIRTDTEKKMTELLKNISNTKGYSVSTKSIVLNENNHTVAYESNISVEVE